MGGDSGECDSGEYNGGEITSENESNDSVAELTESDIAAAFGEETTESEPIESGKSDSAIIETEKDGAVIGEKETEEGIKSENTVSEKVAVDKYSEIEKETSDSGVKKADVDKTYERPSGYRSGMRDTVWENAKDAHGRVRDPNTGRYMSKDQPWDMGHKPGYEFVKHQESAARRGISRQEFLDEHNNPEHYRPELPSSNRSHKGESKTENYYE